MNETKKKSVLHNFVVALGILVSIAVIVLACLQIAGVWENAAYVFVPLLGVNQLCQSLIQWNSNRKVAYFELGTAAFILICAIVVFFVK